MYTQCYIIMEMEEEHTGNSGAWSEKMCWLCVSCLFFPIFFIVFSVVHILFLKCLISNTTVTFSNIQLSYVTIFANTAARHIMMITDSLWIFLWSYSTAIIIDLWLIQWLEAGWGLAGSRMAFGWEQQLWVAGTVCFLWGLFWENIISLIIVKRMTPSCTSH